MTSTPFIAGLPVRKASATNSAESGGNWAQMQASIREFWRLLSEDDVADIAGQRDALMMVLKARYQKSYGELEREVTEFELRDARAAHAARPSLGIGND